MTKVDIVIPVYNEQEQIKKNIYTLHKYLKDSNLNNYKFQILIVDNASNDSTPEIGKKLEKELIIVKYIRIEKKGRGRALKYAWKNSKADIIGYMDLDLSAELQFLSTLLKNISNNNFDIVIGSRLTKGSKVYGRTFLREIMSKGYNLLVKLMFQININDAQCGFKFLKRVAFNKIEPHILNQNWFFDSELLIIASKIGAKIKEVPIIWKDDPSSTVKVASTALEDIKGLIRLKITQPWKNI